MATTLAQRADRFALYQRAVQEPRREVKFLSRAYEAAYGGTALTLREDFCGAAAVSTAWVQSHRQRTAVGVDRDDTALQWGREHNVAALDEAGRERVQLMRLDVRESSGRRFDVVSASNFSFYAFHDRIGLRSYFRAARRHLKTRGIFVLEMMGGSDTQMGERLEGRRCDGFRYFWEQGLYDPISGVCDFYIHFKFSDGSILRRAFHYPWRLWGIAEVREALDEAGFKRTEVYWAQSDRSTGGSNGVYVRRDRAPPDPAWLCYVVASTR